MAECVDKVVSGGSKIFNLADASLDMQGQVNIGVPSDIKLQDVLNNMKRWCEENTKVLE